MPVFKPGAPEKAKFPGWMEPGNEEITSENHRYQSREFQMAPSQANFKREAYLHAFRSRARFYRDG